jgi:type IV secretory pathway VirB10-like protein
LQKEEEEREKLRQQEKEHAEQQEIERQRQLEQQKRDENERLAVSGLPPIIPSAPPAEDENSGMPAELSTSSKAYPAIGDPASHVESAETERCAFILCVILPQI